MAIQDPDAAEVARLRKEAVRLRDTGDPRGALAPLDAAVALRRARAETGGPAEAARLADMLADRGFGALWSSDLAGAEAAFLEALPIWRRLVAATPEDPDAAFGLASALTQLGDVARLGDRFDVAAQRYGQAAPLFAARADAEPASIDRLRQSSQIHEKLGEALGRSGDLAGAKAPLVVALETAKRVATQAPEKLDHHRDVAVTLGKLAVRATLAGDPLEAKARYLETLGLRKTLAAARPNNLLLLKDLATTLMRLGEMEFEAGDFAMSQRFSDEETEVREQMAAAEPGNAELIREAAWAWSRAGTAAARSGDLAASNTRFERSVARFDALAQRAALSSEEQQQVAAMRGMIRVGRG